MADLNDLLDHYKKLLIGKPISKETPTWLITDVECRNGKFFVIHEKEDEPKPFVNSLENYANEFDLDL